MRYIEAPEVYDGGGPSLFVAGGISNCPEWQGPFSEYFVKTELTILNPRRKKFRIDDPTMSNSQISWEFDHLQLATAISFWFPCQTLCPITLFELGRWMMSGKPIFVGTHPDYPRKADVVIQMGLARPDIPIVHSLEALAGQVLEWYVTLETE